MSLSPTVGMDPVVISYVGTQIRVGLGVCRTNINLATAIKSRSSVPHGIL